MWRENGWGNEQATCSFIAARLHARSAVVDPKLGHNGKRRCMHTCGLLYAGGVCVEVR